MQRKEDKKAYPDKWVVFEVIKAHSELQKQLVNYKIDVHKNNGLDSGNMIVTRLPH